MSPCSALPAHYGAAPLFFSLFRIEYQPFLSHHMSSISALMHFCTSPPLSDPTPVKYIPFHSSRLADYNATMLFTARQLFKELSNKFHSPRSTVLSSKHSFIFCRYFNVMPRFRTPMIILQMEKSSGNRSSACDC